MMAKRRHEVLEVAFTLFAERTIEKVSVNDIASATGIGVATIFRYFGTKLSLCVELGALKWNQFAKEIRRNYEEQNCVKKTAYGEFCFFIDSYLLLYKKHQDLLRFNASFDQFVLHEHASSEALTEYYNSVTQFSDLFHEAWEKAQTDHTLRTDIPEQQLFVGTMYMMLTMMQKLASGLIYPKETDTLIPEILKMEQQKKIVELVQKSFALRKQSKQLLEDAKCAVEMAIEQGEDIALKWLESKMMPEEV